ncbi:MAG TPA: Rne/Rng family ribonuclease [Terriglobales bacterium]|nr:Rne/Rng family ribonuclease [Terriglobales bacterium]
MNKELFVTSTPHETKVGLVEDDQLAEIYLERENEYTLAGSIYKGRVTRVLPGMQSAFVDIGLERDAFLYVSDFMDLEEQDDDLTDVLPTNRPPLQESRPAQEPRPQVQRSEAQAPPSGENASYVIESEPFEEEQPKAAAFVPEPGNSDGQPRESQSRDRGDRGGFRGRRRRRGRRDDERPERSERNDRTDRFTRSDVSEAPSAGFSPSRSRSRDSEYGPPPGYQPIILPGESISKYRGRSGQAVVPAAQESARTSDITPTVASNFPDDEPLFATGLTEPLHEQHGDIEHQDEAVHQEWEREHALQDRMNLTAAFTNEPEMEHEEFVEEVTAHDMEEPEPNVFASSAVIEQPAAPPAPYDSPAGSVEEQEIEEEEADITHYVEDLEEDSVFDEMEEETSAAADYQAPRSLEIAATGEPSLHATEEGGEPAGDENSIAAAGDAFAGEAFAGEGESEAEGEEDTVEAEIEDAQAEAEALLDAEARGNGSVDARAEVRAPAGTAAYTQRAQRPAFDRRRGRRGGRRFRSGGGNNSPRRQNAPVPLISDLLKEGQEVLIQIAKEPIGKKGARITSHIALPGRFLVYMPTVNHTGVSRKISSDEERQRLKRIIISERENGTGGFIVRTAAAGASEEDLRADIRFLKNLWHEIKTRSEEGKAPALIYHDLNVVERVLRDQVTSDFSAIWVDTETEYERILRFANRFQPALVRRVKLYTKDTPLFEQFGLKEEIDKALKSKVWLKSGGYIVINQTEALVAIDINTGKYVGKTARLEDTIVKTNVDAIKEIVRQIRLRDLGGIIVIDFIDMDERRNRQKVMQALEEELRNDRAPSKVLQFNDFGLVAITRKRVKQSLERTIGSPCPHCEATGFIKSVTTVCNEIYVEMRKMAKQMERQDILLRVNPEVGKALKAQNGRWLTEMEELTKRTIIVKSDGTLHEEQFDIN